MRHVREEAPQIQGKKELNGKKSKKGKTVVIVILVIFVIGFCIGTFMFLRALINAMHEKETFDSLAQMVQDTDDKNDDGSLRKYDELYKKNPDFFGWLKIEGTVIDYPVMQAADENPHYYLRHNLWHEWSIGGNPYIDHRCTADGQNIIVYGHHMGSIGTMFTPLYDCYRQTEFDAVLANNNLYWSTPDSGTTELHAVCAMRVDDEYATVQKFSFEDQNDFQSWIRQMVSESSAQYSDWEARTSKATRAIALVTCSSLWSGSSARTVVLFAGN